MKKFTIFLVSVLVLVLALAAYPSDKDRVNKMNPVAKTVNMGYMLDQINAALRGEEVLTAAVTLAAGSSDTAKIAISAHTIWVDGVFYSIPATELAFTATTHDCASTKWRTYRVSMEADSTGVITAAASTYSTRALAMAALPACPAGDVNLGYIVVYADGALFDATTTKLNASTVDVEYFPATNYITDLDN
jgi:hypothetical protein